MARPATLMHVVLWVAALTALVVRSPHAHADEGLDDKALHAIVGAALGAGYLLTPNEAPEHGLLLTLGVALTLIIGKEAYDALGDGTPEWADVGAGWVPAMAMASLLYVVEVEGGLQLRLLAPHRKRVGVSVTWHF